MTVDRQSRVSISYVGELEHTPAEHVIVVETDADYVRACFLLSGRGEQHDIQTVWVRKINHFAWLQDFAQQIDLTAAFEEKTPKLILADQWNVTLPDWVTDADVISHNLLRLSVAPKELTSLENRLLSHLLGLVFQDEILNATNITEIIKTLVSDNARAAFSGHPILRRCLRTKCERWAENSPEAWAKNVGKLLCEDPTQLWQWLSLWEGLHGYPEKLLNFVLTPEQVALVKQVPFDAVSDLPLEPTATDQIVEQIELFFSEISDQVVSGDKFRKVLAYTSGQFFQEYEQVTNILKERRFSPTLDDIHEVQTKFRFCSGVTSNQLIALTFLVKPKRPTLLGPGEVWKAQKWMQWTAEEYIPYRTWQIYNKFYDQDLENTVASFSKWCVDEYTSIHKDPDLSLVYCLKNLMSRASKDDFSVILLVDCLPLTYMGLLDDALRSAGFSRHELRKHFAVLPTITEKNKPCLLMGDWVENQQSYETILKERANNDWEGKKIFYLHNLKMMAEMTVPQEPAVVVFNFIDGDEVLHSDVESKNTTYEDELYRLFTRVAEAVDRLHRMWSGKGDFNIYIVTDHGACRVLEEERRSFDSTVVNKLFTNERHRFAGVAENKVDNVPRNLWKLGQRFKNPFVSDGNVYFLPTGHNTVRRTGSLKGYLHGGVTPEEVIVPSALYKSVKAVCKKPAVRFLKPAGRAIFYIKRITPLEIEIQNPNTIDIRILRASITSPDAELKSCESITVAAKSTNFLRLNCYFKKTALDQKTLEIEIVYEIGGEQHTLLVARESEFKSAMSGGFNLKDL